MLDVCGPVSPCQPDKRVTPLPCVHVRRRLGLLFACQATDRGIGHAECLAWPYTHIMMAAEEMICARTLEFSSCSDPNQLESASASCFTGAAIVNVYLDSYDRYTCTVQ